jgi:hypothetical protein
MLARQSVSHKKAQKAQRDFHNQFVPFVLFCGQDKTKRDRPRGRSL